MNILDKLTKIKATDSIAIYKWMYKGKKIANSYIALSDLRFIAFTSNNGVATLTSAAPILFMERNRPIIQFRDSNIVTIVDGKRAGINVDVRFVKPNETFVETRHCFTKTLTTENLEHPYIQSIVSDMVTRLAYPVSAIRVPELYRISKDVKNFKPLLNKDTIAMIGGLPSDTVEQLMDKFYDSIAVFGLQLEDGLVISNNYVISGGCCVCSSQHMTSKYGSEVFFMPYNSYVKNIQDLHWKIGGVDEVV